MGVRGLTKLLISKGILHTNHNESFQNENVTKFKFHGNIPPYSTLAFDGSSLVFHLFQTAFYQHYRKVTSMAEKFNDEVHLLTHLLPSMVPLSTIKLVVDNFLHQLLSKYKVHVQIYLDGHIQRMKQHTHEERRKMRALHESNLRLFLTKCILPKSPRGVIELSKFHIPTADFFLENFPLPKLCFDQILHSFKLMEQNIDTGIMKTNQTFRVISCTEEADRSVAAASAIDTSNKTFAVGTDSDYLIYGFPMDHNFWDIGDMHVQYAPLNLMQFGEENLESIILTRKDIADAFNISEDLLVEASIIMGNDYTSEFGLKETNFYTDFCNENELRLMSNEILECLADAEGTYQITSLNPKFQVAIDFTRDLLGFGSIRHYPIDGYDKDSDLSFSDDSKADSIFTSGLDYSRTTIAVDEMKIDDDSPNTLYNQILAPFRDDYEDEKFKVKERYLLIEEVLQSIPNGIVQDNALLTQHINWENEVISHQFQESIRTAFQDRERRGIPLIDSCSPATIFHPFIFHNIANKKSDTNNIDSKRNTLSSLSEKDLCEKMSNIALKPSQIKHKSPTVSDKYDKVLSKSRTTLPIDEYKEEILSNVRDHRVTIIQGETGCGKSSRVPIMLLQSQPPEPNMKEVKMFICQPRRIAAKSLVDRIRSTEPLLKNLIGLRMGLGVREYESKATRAWFCTTGYLVRLIAKYPNSFDDCTHLVIDEVHERSVDTDVLCLLARRLLTSNPSIRLVLMSATVSANMYRKYFGVTQEPIFVGRRCFPIREFFIEELADKFNFGSNEIKQIQNIRTKCLSTKCKTAPNAHYMKMLHNLAVTIALAVGDDTSSVLIFVPGMADIVSITELIEETVWIGKKVSCIPIHSDVPFEEQLIAFEAPKIKEVKVIIATNSAESSITLPDVDHVICTGLCKQIVYNSKSHRQMLESSWISKASATQRSGRTGRVREGNVYRLYPKEAYNEYMIPFDVGEILRTPLDSVILNMRTIVHESITELLLDCLEPPSVSNISKSFNSLFQSGFIKSPDDCFELTSLGSLVVSLGIDLTLGAMIGLGIQFGIVAETIEIANILSFPKSPWLIPNLMLQGAKKHNEIASKSYKSMAYFDSGLYSESLAIMNLLWDFEKYKMKNYSFCNKFNVSLPRLQRLKACRDNLIARVAKYLKRKPQDLCIVQPPRSLSYEKITLLQFIHVCLFHDNIVRLNSKNSFSVKPDGSITMQLTSSDIVEENHIYQLLDRTKHPISLETRQDSFQSGYFVPEIIDGEPYLLEYEDFEERLLSLGLEKGFQCIFCCYQDNINALYVLKEKSDFVESSIEIQFQSNEIMYCCKNRKINRGWKSRECGVYSVQRDDSDGEEMQDIAQEVLVKYFNSNLDKKKKRQAKGIVTAHLKSMNLRTMVMIIDNPKIKNISSSWKLTLRGGPHLTLQNFKDLFSSPNITIGQEDGQPHQMITFHEAPTTPTNSSLSRTWRQYIHNAPEGMRILSAVAATKKRKPTILLLKEENEGSEDSTYEVYLSETHHCHRWKQYGSSLPVLVSETSFPASVVPLNGVEVYACCANSLLLRGDAIKVEGMTVLPFGDNFISLVKKCIGIESSNFDLDPDVEELADQFFTKYSQNRGKKLFYLQDESALLFKLFNLLRKSDINQIDLVESESKTKKIVEVETSTDNSVLKTKEIIFDKTDFEESIVASSSKEMQRSSGNLQCRQIGEKKLKAGFINDKYICFICNGAAPFNWEEFKKHLEKAHNETLSIMENIQIPNQTKKNVYHCLMCGMETLDRNEIYSHAFKKHELTSKNYQCLHCGKKPFTRNQLKQHLISIHKIKLSKKKRYMIPYWMLGKSSNI